MATLWHLCWQIEQDIMERFCPNGWGCKHFPMKERHREDILSWFSSACKCGKSWTFSLQYHWPWKTNNPVVQPSFLQPILPASGSVQCWCFWDLSKEQNSWDSDLCSVLLLTLIGISGEKKKKGIKTPTTLNTRSGPVSHGSLANTQKCILLSGISLTANMCSCLLVLKWYVIMNFPVEMGMS